MSAEQAALETVARAAQDLWVAAQIDRGWSPGEHYDAQRQLDDTLTGFDDLDPTERASLCFALKAEDIPAKLLRIVEQLRTPPRVLRATELKIGLPVRFGQDRGIIDDWKTLPDGRLDQVRVRWSDGALTSHDPLARELRLG